MPFPWTKLETSLSLGAVYLAWPIVVKINLSALFAELQVQTPALANTAGDHSSRTPQASAQEPMAK